MLLTCGPLILISQEDKMSFIYLITNKINGKQYVGKTNRTIAERFKEHIRDAQRPRCEKRPLYSAIRKYGANNFFIEEIEECPADLASDREIYWISQKDTYSNGYNATRGVDSKSYIDRTLAVNLYHHYKNISQTANFLGIDPGWLGKILQEEGIQKYSSGQIMRQKYGKKIIMKTANGEELKSFPSVSAASKYLIEKRKVSGDPRGIQVHIRQVARGERKIAYGYKWSFA